MRKHIFLLIGVLVLFSFVDFSGVKKYNLIRIVTRMIPGTEKMVKVAEINKSDVNKLSGPLKGLAAYCSALAGNNCDGTHCELTTALGLGVQGSDKQKELIKEWFPNDPVAKALIAEDCFQSPNSSSRFTNYKKLIFEVNGDTITIDYEIIDYDHGKSSIKNDQDKAVVHNNQAITITRRSL
jgi:hypothetical protein